MRLPARDHFQGVGTGSSATFIEAVCRAAPYLAISAARLEGIAKPGSICLSDDAYRQVKSRLDLAASDLGAIQLKNIAVPVRVFSLVRDVYRG